MPILMCNPLIGQQKRELLMYFYCFSGKPVYPFSNHKHRRQLNKFFVDSNSKEVFTVVVKLC